MRYDGAVWTRSENSEDRRKDSSLITRTASSLLVIKPKMCFAMTSQLDRSEELARDDLVRVEKNMKIA